MNLTDIGAKIDGYISNGVKYCKKELLSPSNVQSVTKSYRNVHKRTAKALSCAISDFKVGYRSGRRK